MFDNSYTDNHKRFWSLVKRLRKNYEPVATLYADDSLQTTPASKAEALNQQFYSVFTEEDNNTPIISSPQYSIMPEVIFTTNELQKLLEDLKSGKATEPDNIPTWILKVPYSGKVWRIDSFQAFGERKFGELIDQPIDY